MDLYEKLKLEISELETLNETQANLITEMSAMIDKLTEENLDFKDKLAKNKKPYERFLPCTCGCNRRDLWNVLDVHWYKCKKCGLTSGKRRTTAGAKKAWNSMIKARVKKNGNT